MNFKNIFLVMLIVLAMVSLAAVSASQDNVTADELAESENATVSLAVDDDAIADDSDNRTDDVLESSDETVLGGDDFDLSKAYDYINEFRTQKGVWYWKEDNATVTYFNTGANNQLMPLQRDSGLEQAAKIRALEFSQHPEYEHIRPDGSPISDLDPCQKSECLAYASEHITDLTMICVVLWKEDADFYAGQGHRRAMLEGEYDCMGLAAVKANGYVYYALELGRKNGGSSSTQPEQPLSGSQKSFTDLNTLINGGSQITLDRDYAYISSDSSLKNGIEIKKSLTIDGKGHIIDGRNIAKLFKITAGNVVFKNITFKNGSLYGARGAITADNCKVSFINCIFMDNAAYYGGAICAANAKLSVEKCTFKNNFAVRGGTIFLEYCNSTISGSQFIGNGAVFQSGAIYSSRGNISISNSNFEDNYADRYVYACGGAIYSADKVISISKCIFSSNTASNGSAIFFNKANAILINSQFLDGAAGYGGAIFSTNSKALLRNCSFRGNTLNEKYGVSLLGSAIYLSGGEISIEKCKFTNNTSPYGGVVYLSKSKVSIEGSDFIGNSAEVFASALYLTDDDEVSIINSRFIDNKVDTLFGESYGGLIYSLGNKLYFRGCEFSNNRLNGLYDADGLIYSDRYISAEDCVFTNNAVTLSRGLYEYKNGGGVIYSCGGEAVIKNCNFTANTAEATPNYFFTKYNGALSLINTSAHIGGCIFKDNVGIYGGAIFLESCDAAIDSCEFKSNDATYGGAIYFSDGVISIERSYFTNNSSPYRGGSLHLSKGEISISDSDFIANSAAYSASALYLADDDEVSIINSRFISNRANTTESLAYGGLIYSSGSKLSLVGCDFSNNELRAVRDAKGLIYSDRYIFTDGCSFTNNIVTASREGYESEDGGGVIYACGGDAVIKNSNFTANIAKCNTSYYFVKYGAGALSLRGINANIENCIFKDNTGIHGGAILVESSNATINRCEFKSNVAKYGGAIYFSNDNFNADGCTFINNTAKSKGDAFYLDAGKAKILNSAFDKDPSTLVYGSITIKNSTIFAPKNTKFIAEDFTTYDMSNELFSFKLVDKSGKPVANRQVTLKVDGTTYDLTTDSNGVASKTISLNSAQYKAVLKFAGDENYLSCSRTVYINVKLKVTLTSVITQYADNIYLNLTVSKVKRPNAIVEFNGKNESYPFEDGVCNIAWNKLKNGNYVINVYLNDEFIYNRISHNVTINVKKTNLVAENFTTYEKSNEQFSFKLVDNSGKAVSNRQVTLKIGSTTYDLTTDAEGIAKKKISLNSGNYKTVMKFAGDENYQSCSRTVYIKVKQKVTITSNLSKYADNVYLNLTLSKSINADVTVEFNGKNKTYAFTNGVCNVAWSKLKNGKYTVNVYMDDNEFVYNSVSGSVTVNVKKTQIIAENFTTYDKSRELLYVKLVDASGNPLSGKKIILHVIGKDFPIYTDGKGIANRSINLDAGVYDATLSFDGDDAYGASQAAVCINVKQKVTITSSLTKYADNAYLNLTLSKAINASVIVEFDSKNKTYAFTNGVCNVAWSKLKNGKHTVRVYMDDDRFMYNSVSGSVTVNVKKTQIIAENFTTYDKSKEQFYVKLVDESGNPLSDKKIILHVIGKDFTITTNEEGIANRSINLDAGVYEATLSFNGDDNYFASQATVFLNVKQKVKITSSLSKYSNTASLNLTLSKSINTTFIINANGKNKTYNFDNGKFNIKWSNLKNKEYTIRIYMDEDRFIYNEVSETFTINVAKTYIVLDENLGVDNMTTTVGARLYHEDGGTIFHEDLEFVIGDESFNARTVAQLGVAFIKYTFEEPGVYPVTVNYLGCDEYKASSVSGEIRIRQGVNPKVTADVSYNNATISIDMGAEIDGNVTVSINNGDKYYLGAPTWNSYTVKLSKGKGVLYLNDLKNRTYGFKVEFENDDYALYDDSRYYEFTVNAARTELSAENVEAVAGKEIAYTVMLLESGMPFANQTVVVYLNGERYSGMTNDDGLIDFTFNLTGGNYSVTINYEGSNNTFMPSKLLRNILIKTSTLLPQDSEFSSNSQYQVTLLDGEGKPLSNRQVNVEIDGEKTVMTTDGDGKLSIDLNLKAGNHTIRITNPATGEIIRKDIAVVSQDQKVQNPQTQNRKANPKIIIKTKNISVKKGKKIKFKATLSYSNGKPIIGKKVTFKFKGKKYKVKTNRKGVAKLKLKLKLKKGKYKIKTKYGKVTVKNTIKIK